MTTLVPAYRSLEAALEHRVAGLARRRAGEGDAVAAARRVIVRRVGRAAAGAVGVAYGAATLIVGLAATVSSHQEHLWKMATELLLSAWPQALVAGIAGRVAARFALRGRFPTALVAPGAPQVRRFDDFASLEAFDPLRRAREVAMSWERASTALPLAALSLLTPLTLHWVVAMVIWPGPLGLWHGALGLAEYGQWIMLSAVIVGHAHLALLLCAVRWARSLRLRETHAVGADVFVAWAKALAIASACAACPGLVLFGVPPVLTSLTGLAFIPFMYLWTVRRVVEERFSLET